MPWDSVQRIHLWGCILKSQSVATMMMGSKKHRGTYQEKILHLKIFPKNISSVLRSQSKSGRMRRHSHSPKASWSTACREVAAKLTTKTWLAVTSADPAMPKAWEILLQVARMSSWPKRDGAGQLVWKAASKTEKSIALQGGCKTISQSLKEVRERFQEKKTQFWWIMSTGIHFLQQQI